MKAIVVYKSESDHARVVEDYLRDFKMRTGREIETVNPDTSDGAGLCRAYDIVEYPSVLAMTDDGQVLSSWRGLPLPTISELSYYN
jgi:Cu2+-containing amine oxidase